MAPEKQKSIYMHEKGKENNTLDGTQGDEMMRGQYFISHIQNDINSIMEPKIRV